MKKYLCYLSLILAILAAYNQNQAILQAKYSVISHCSNAQIENWNCTLCKTYPHLTQISVIENTTTKIKGFVGYDVSTNKIVVSWRGTDNNVNWIQNMDFKLVDYIGPFRCSNCKIHAGFYAAYQSVSNKTHEKVKQLTDKYPNAKIIVTGHSLGGALAFIGTIFLQREFPAKFDSIYFYGCPRVGNSNLAGYLHLIVPNVYRVIHYKDLVPHLPPQELQYGHPPYEIFYDETMKYFIVCNESGEDPKCSNSLAPNYSMNDHTTYWFKTDSSIC